MTTAFLAIVNPAAGHGRCGRRVAAALDRLRAAGVDVDVVRTRRPGEAAELARAAYRAGRRAFLAAGGDGTAFQGVNGLFPEALEGPRPRLGLLPLGTGNSFLRDFGPGTVEHALEAIAAGRARACDVNEVRHEAGVVYSMNLVSLGFVADVAVTASRGFKRLGAAGYLLAVGAELARLEPRAFPLRHDDEPALDRRRCLFLSFNNSRFTGGSMLIAPHADPADGLIECVRWDPVGRLRLVWNLPTLFTGAHIRHPRASRRAARRVEFALDGPVDVMIDGEVLRLACRSIEVRPAAIDVLA